MQRRQHAHDTSDKTVQILSSYLFRKADNNDICRKFIQFNRQLDGCAQLVLLNEGFIEDLLRQADSISKEPCHFRRLTLMRLTELLLFLAGNYAVNGCFAEVGDLVVNPRLIHIHIKGRLSPVVKQRHVPLTVQFEQMAPTRMGIIEWLKCNTVTEIKEKALFPHLQDLLKQEGCPDEYLSGTEARMAAVSDFVGCLSMQPMPDSIDSQAWVHSLEEQGMISSKTLPCRIDRTFFHLLGDEVRSMAKVRHCHNAA